MGSHSLNGLFHIAVTIITAMICCAWPNDSKAADFLQIRIQTPLSATIEEALTTVDIELMSVDDGSILLLASGRALAKLDEMSVEYEVVIEDLEALYMRDMARVRTEEGGGNFGPFHTYDETVVAIHELHFEFPHIVSEPVSIGQSLEGRDIWAIKISDNPEVDEDEPEVLFDSLHHAREIMTVEMLLSFSRYLCENYQADPTVKTIVDGREVWFVPVVNPDGVVFNEFLNPNGGALWRKNRRITPGHSCIGVDLNRNYDYAWGPPGSSGEPCDEIYRGEAPNSEPETQVLTAFIDAHEFVIWQSYHAVAGMVLIPWGHTEFPTPHDQEFREMGQEMARENGYIVGQAPHILYPVNGGSFDWGYGREDLHRRIFGFTTEIGGTRFWPEPAEIEPLIAENLAANLYLCRVAGGWLETTGLRLIDDGSRNGLGNARLDPGETGSLALIARNASPVAHLQRATAWLSCDDPYVRVLDSRSKLGSFDPSEEKDLSRDLFLIEIDPRCPEGRIVSFSIHAETSEDQSASGRYELTIGDSDIISLVDFETNDGGWGTDPSHDATAGTFVRIDPNATDYQPGDDATEDPGVFGWITGQNDSNGTEDVDRGVAASRSPDLDLAEFEQVRLELSYFHGQAETGDDPDDYFRIDVSNDGGSSYPVNLVTIGDQVTAPTWQSLEVNLEELIELTSNVVLRVQASDGPDEGDVIEAGVDDILFYEPGGSANQYPFEPIAVSPVDGEPQPPRPTLVVDNTSDPDGDELLYGFRIFSDSLQSQLVAENEGVVEGREQTSWTLVDPLEPGVYYWRAFASDGSMFGLYSEREEFVVVSPSSVEEPGLISAARLEAGPVPSNGAVRIRYYTPSVPRSEIGIFDAAGRRIQSLPGARWSDGWHEISWDGRDAKGELAPTGVYWVRLELPTQSRAVRIVRIR